MFLRFVGALLLLLIALPMGACGVCLTLSWPDLASDPGIRAMLIGSMGLSLLGMFLAFRLLSRSE